MRPHLHRNEAPAFPHVEVGEELGKAGEERIAVWIRAGVENLGVGDYENVGGA